MDPITPVIERCEKRLEEVRAILAVWNEQEYNENLTGRRAKLQREEMDLVTIIPALKNNRKPMIISDVCEKKIKRIVDNEIRNLVKLEITCPYCGKHYSIDKLSNFPEDRNE